LGYELVSGATPAAGYDLSESISQVTP
jgi:hypothetical protein